MPVELLFNPAEVDIPTVNAIRAEWPHVLERRVQQALAQEEQSLRFHRCLLAQLRCTQDGAEWERPVDLTWRAGLTRSCILQAGSIAETCLWYHALRRGRQRPPNDRGWTLGAALSRWDGNGQGPPDPDIALIWEAVQEIKDIRNHVHLLRRLNDDNGDFEWLNGEENRLLGEVDRVVAHLKQLQSDPA